MKGRITRYLMRFRNKSIKTKSNKVRELTKELISQGACQPQDKQLCLIYLAKLSNDPLMNTISNIKDKYANDNLNFYYHISKNGDTLLKTFPDFSINNDHFVIYKSFRQKYAIFSNTPTEQHITDFIDSVLTGERATHKADKNYFKINS